MTLVLISLLMVSVCVLLLMDHFVLHYSFGPQHTSCALSDLGGKFDCESVALSPYSTPMGVPLAGLAMAYAFWLLCLSFVSFRSSVHPLWVRTARISSAFAVLVSAFYLVVMITVVKKLCPFCLALDGLIVAFAGLVWSYRPPTPPPADIATLAETKTRVVLSACLSVALAALIAGIVIMRDHPSSETLAQFATQWKDGKSIDIPKDAHDPIIGPREGSVVLDITVFSDFECPFCAAAAFQLDRFAKQHPEQVRIRFKHFPLNPSCNPAAPGGGHQHACERAFLAQCAAEQGKFEDFHNRLFRNQRETLDEKVFQKWSAELGLNYDELKNCADRPETRQKIKLSAMEGEALQIRGTPTIYANGKLFELPPTLTNLALLFNAQGRPNNH